MNKKKSIVKRSKTVKVFKKTIKKGPKTTIKYMAKPKKVNTKTKPKTKPKVSIKKPKTIIKPKVRKPVVKSKVKIKLAKKKVSAANSMSGQITVVIPTNVTQLPPFDLGDKPELIPTVKTDNNSVVVADLLKLQEAAKNTATNQVEANPPQKTEDVGVSPVTQEQKAGIPKVITDTPFSEVKRLDGMPFEEQIKTIFSPLHTITKTEVPSTTGSGTFIVQPKPVS